MRYGVSSVRGPQPRTVAADGAVVFSGNPLAACGPAWKRRAFARVRVVDRTLVETVPDGGVSVASNPIYVAECVVVGEGRRICLRETGKAPRRRRAWVTGWCRRP